jgi:peroxiredoxin
MDGATTNTRGGCQHSDRDRVHGTRHSRRASHLSPDLPRTPRGGGEGSYQLGDYIRDTPELQIGTAQRTLLLFTASTCKYCNESLSFWRMLSASAQSTATRLVAVSAESAETNREYLERNGVRVAAVASTRTNAVRPLPTPTLLLLRRDGRITHAWRGKVSPSIEREILAVIAAQP